MLKISKKYLKNILLCLTNIIYKKRMEKPTIIEIFLKNPNFFNIFLTLISDQNQPWQPKYLHSKMFVKKV